MLNIKLINGLIIFKILISYGSIGSHAGIDKNKSKLQQLKLVAYEHDMIKLMDDFEATLVQIQSKGEQFSNHTLCLFKAFETSHDPIFNNYIQTFKDKWNDGEDINWTVLADKAIQRYKELCEAGIWKSADAKKKTNHGAYLCNSVHDKSDGSYSPSKENSGWT